MILEIVPDWRQLWTKAEVERELINFSFHGVGWYFDGTGGAMLVSESGVKNIEPNIEDTNKRYWFHYWAVSPIDSFNWVANAPVVEDLRK